jgi:magnesium and cobalt transporter
MAFMSEDISQKPSHSKSWIDRLSHLLHREPQNKKELLDLLHDAVERKLIDPQALEMIEGVMEVTQMQVRDIMIPRSKMVVIDEEDTPQEFIQKIKTSGHSRFPVIGENKDQVIGLLLAKDLIDTDIHAKNFSLSPFMRTPTFVPESKRLDVLLKEFRQNRNHMAIVIDEYGQVAGLVTIEDVLEEIVGDIADEHDKESQDTAIKKIGEYQYIVPGLTQIEDFNEFFNCELDDDEFDTIGGLITHALGHMPIVADEVIIEPFIFRVLQAEKRRLKTLEVYIKQPIE